MFAIGKCTRTNIYIAPYLLMIHIPSASGLCHDPSVNFIASRTVALRVPTIGFGGLNWRLWVNMSKYETEISDCFQGYCRPNLTAALSIEQTKSCECSNARTRHETE